MKNTAPPARLWGLSLVLGLIGWGCSALRHQLLQSNAYDLGLFDQWSWLIGSGKEPISSMENVHLLADHGAWLFYLAGWAYGLFPSIQWLFASQAMALSLTAIPIWLLARDAELPPKLCWLSCTLWWLQPVVFNANLFDFHPEVWAMPALAGALWAERQNKPWLWLTLLLLMLGCRDGLLLITLGLAIDLAFRKRWRWSLAAFSLSISWLLLLSRWLYPFLRGGEGPKAASRMFSYLGSNLNEILINLLTSPGLIINHLDWLGGLQYLLFISIVLAPFWRCRSIPVLMAATPLLLVNLLSESSSYRTLIHHYSLPIAVIAVAGAIDGLSQNPPRRFPWVRLGWVVACWVALAKPWFFTGPYLQRLALLPDTRAAITEIKANDAVLTTSYLVPQLSQREEIAFARRSMEEVTKTNRWNILLLNPSDPGWGSSRDRQQQLLDEVQQAGWTCKNWPSGLERCERPPQQTKNKE